jgi:glucose/arabinose dehydrogenase
MTISVSSREATVKRLLLTVVACGFAAIALSGQAQEPQPAMPPKSVPSTPFVIDTAEQGQVRVAPIKGVSNPWALEFLPNGDMLLTERPGRLRIVRNGVVQPKPISGVPTVHAEGLGGLMGLALHPRFAENRLVYLSYTKPVGGGRHTPALSRGRLEDMALVDVKEIFVADTPGKGPAAGCPIIFGRDGFLYMAIGGANDDIAQRGDSHQGKMLRLRDDGTAAPNNPFAGKAGFKPEIYSIGHRNMIGLTIHPATGEIWENENGPLGGDEVNILKAGANYGWPLVSLGRQYSGAKVSERFQQAGLEDPVLHWTPSIAISGMTFYTGDRFPRWKNNLFVGGLQYGRIPGTGQMHRVVFNENWEELRREAFFVDLRQRIRNVKQGPDGLLYVLTDEQDGAILRLEPMAKGS